MNRITFFLLTLGLSLVPILCWAAEPNPEQATAAAGEPRPKASGDDATQLKALQEERIKVLEELVQISLAQYRVGTLDFDQLCSAQHELCDAQLDSTDEPEKRVALLTKQVAIANDALKVVQARFDAGTATDREIRRAKSLLLGLNIKLLRERNGKRPPTPSSAKTAGGGDATATNEEYKVILMLHKPDGQKYSQLMDPKTLETTLNELAKQGWKVRTTTSEPRYVILARPRS